MDMSENWRANPSMLWGALIAEAFVRQGGRHAVISPGSRSAPLAIAFHSHEDIATQVVLDERSAAFFALGIAKTTRDPVALVCTSGTAGANYLPAVVEASESNVPLLLLTADRPPELRGCQAGQAIHQPGLYGCYVRWACDLDVPEADEATTDSLREKLASAFAACVQGRPGPVHVNVPFREPLYPEARPMPARWSAIDSMAQWATALSPPERSSPSIPPDELVALRNHLANSQRGWIVVGYGLPGSVSHQARAVGKLSNMLGMPVFEGGLSGLRGYAPVIPALLSQYEPLLMHEAFMREHAPDTVLVFGALPTSKRLRAFLSKCEAEIIYLNASGHPVDCLHRGREVALDACSLVDGWELDEAAADYAQSWVAAHAKVTEALDAWMRDCAECYEGKLSWLLPHLLPAGASVVYSSSMPVRELETFWHADDTAWRVVTNRGANGIDGTLSTALGVAEASEQSTYLVTGDLAFLHDVNGLLQAKRLRGALTVILVNNCGGGIFGHLPIAAHEPPFEELFATPQAVDFAMLCAAHGVGYQRCEDWQVLKRALTESHDKGVRVLELQTNRTADVQTRRVLLEHLREVVSGAL